MISPGTSRGCAEGETPNNTENVELEFRKKMKYKLVKINDFEIGSKEIQVFDQITVVY